LFEPSDHENLRASEIDVAQGFEAEFQFLAFAHEKGHVISIEITFGSPCWFQTVKSLGEKNNRHPICFLFFHIE